MKYIPYICFLLFCLGIGFLQLSAKPQEQPVATKVEEPKLPILDDATVQELRPLVAQRDQIVAQAQVLYKQLNDLNNQMNELNSKWRIVEEKALGKANLDYGQYALDPSGTKFSVRPQQGQQAPTNPVAR